MVDTDKGEEREEWQRETRGAPSLLNPTPSHEVMDHHGSSQFPF